jgi:hypothetical protein
MLHWLSLQERQALYLYLPIFFDVDKPMRSLRNRKFIYFSPCISVCCLFKWRPFYAFATFTVYRIVLGNAVPISQKRKNQWFAHGFVSKGITLCIYCYFRRPFVCFSTPLRWILQKKIFSHGCLSKNCLCFPILLRRPAPLFWTLLFLTFENGEMSFYRSRPSDRNMYVYHFSTRRFFFSNPVHNLRNSKKPVVFPNLFL